LSEREQVRESVPAFVRFLCDVDDFLRRHERDCFATTSCIADGLGNYLLRKGMEYLADYLGAPSGRMLFAETVMLAPDLAAADIETGGKAASIAGFSRRVHVYYSKHDRTLKGSGAGRFGAPRLGRHGAEDYSRIPGNVVLVDASHYANAEAIEGLRDRSGKAVSVHGAYRYHPVILADIERVLSSIDRKHIQGRVYLGDTLLAGGRENHFVLA
jgi:esterase/lipase superfamily enzyme